MQILHAGRRRARARTVAGALAVTTLALAGVSAPGLALASRSGPAKAKAAGHGHDSGANCHLGNGVKHVVEITFDNVHFFRDNPNVPSDMEMLPNLLNFIEGNGTMLSNNHTPLIAHTADDLLTTFTGLYGDRAGMPVSNTYQSYNADGTTNLDDSFTYWTDKIDDEASPPNPGADTNPSLVYSPAPPATASPPVSPSSTTPAPWVPFTKAGCNVGEVGAINQELENTSPDIADAFGANSPEVAQLKADPDSFKDPETADYVGLGVHCAQGAAFCAGAEAVKYGQTSPSPTAVPDVLPDEPGGYNGFQVLFGNKYIAPQLGGGTPNVMHNGYQVTNAAGNLVDLNGNQINGAFLTNYPGFPGYSNINASQTLAYMADMLENGVPVVNGYISDLHGPENIPSLSGPGEPCYKAPGALGSGSACYIAQAQYYNQAFGIFFKRLASDGITAKNTLFIFSSDEGDHEAGANVGRAIQPTPSNCDGATVSGDTVTPDVLCTYPSGSFGELDGNINGMLSAAGNTVPYSLEADTAPEFYVTGDPGPNDPQVRGLEHTVAGLTSANPYTGTTQPITNYIADPAEEAILHMVNADPARTPTFALFAKPDYYFYDGSSSCSGSCVVQSTAFAYDHGDYAAEINSNWVGFAGPGVQNLGLDGPAANAGINSAGANSGQLTASDFNEPGPWVDETDIRPTLLYLTGLNDVYEPDGRVISQILSKPNKALSAPGVTELGECYKQLNSSVGEFGAQTLIASTNAVESSSGGDATYQRVNSELHWLDVARDQVAGTIKGDLEAAAFQGTPVQDPFGLTQRCQGLITAAHWVAATS